MYRTIGPLIVTVALALLPAAASAHQKPSVHHGQKLSLHHGRARIARAVTEDIADQKGATGAVRHCWRRGRRTVACWIHEEGVEIWGLDGWIIDLVYSVRRGDRSVMIG